MNRTSSRVLVALSLAVAGSISSIPAVAGAPATPPAASGAVAATRSTPSSLGIVSVNETSTMSATTIAQVRRAAEAAGAEAYPAQAAQVAMTSLSRGDTVVQAPPTGYRIPMGLTAIPPEVAYELFPTEVARSMEAGGVVLGQTSADLRGARVGDVVRVLDAAGRTQALTIDVIAADDVVGGAELLVSSETAAGLGITSTTRMLIFGFTSRSAIDSGLAAQGLVRFRVRISRSWDPRTRIPR
ncbi:MAG: hypothetical protein R2715_18715 [Ilumatobacteraceae bacterium]